jgi:hypothetical protein
MLLPGSIFSISTRLAGTSASDVEAAPFILIWDEISDTYRIITGFFPPFVYTATSVAVNVVELVVLNVLA